MKVEVLPQTDIVTISKVVRLSDDDDDGGAEDEGVTASGGVYCMDSQGSLWKKLSLASALLMGFDYIILGHHSVEAQFHNVIAAGSWPGGTEFSIKGMQASGMPSAPFFGVDKRFGKTWRRDIQLRPR